MCVELLPSKRSENGFYVESVNAMAHVRNALERKLEFNPIKTNKKWPIPFERQERSGIAQNFPIPCVSTHKSTRELWIQFRVDAIQIFSIRLHGSSFGIYCVFTRNLGYGYISGKYYKTTQKNLSTDSVFFFKIVVVVVVSMSFSTCSQKFPRAQKSVQKHFGLVFNYFPLLLSRCLFSWESSHFCRKCYRRGTFSTIFTIQRRERLNKASKIKGEAEMVERYINYNFLFKLFFSSTLSHSSSHTLNESILSWHIVIYNAYPEYVVSNCCDV